MKRFPGQIALGQFAPETGGFDQIGRCDMVRVSVEPVRGENPARAGQAKQTSELGSIFKGRFEESVGSPKLYLQVTPKQLEAA